MKRILVLALSSVALLAASASRGQAPEANDEKLLALVKEVQAQQTQIAENQGKIEAKLAEIAETIRVARIFTSRGK
jgi:hypothetical protein